MTAVRPRWWQYPYLAWQTEWANGKKGLRDFSRLNRSLVMRLLRQPIASYQRAMVLSSAATWTLPDRSAVITYKPLKADGTTKLPLLRSLLPTTAIVAPAFVLSSVSPYVGLMWCGSIVVSFAALVPLAIEDKLSARRRNDSVLRDELRRRLAQWDGPAFEAGEFASFRPGAGRRLGELAPDLVANEGALEVSFTVSRRLCQRYVEGGAVLVAEVESGRYYKALLVRYPDGRWPADLQVRASRAVTGEKSEIERSEGTEPAHSLPAGGSPSPEPHPPFLADPDGFGLHLGLTPDGGD